MTDVRSQSNYQLRLGWGSVALDELAAAHVIVIVDALETTDTENLAAAAANLPDKPAVYRASLRNATATAQAIYDEQVNSGELKRINLVLAGDEREGFAVEDYLAAGAVADALTNLGIDHSAPDVAVAGEGFRSLKQAVKHLISASAAGLALKEAGRKDVVKAAGELDADSQALRFTE